MAIRVRICGIGLSVAFLVSTARADTMHVVARGHTIEAIAHRYRVSEKAIISANHLSDPAHLKPGQMLVIPGVETGKKRQARPGPGNEANGESGHRGPRGAKAESLHSAGSSRARTSAEGQDGPDLAERETVHVRRRGAEFDMRVKGAGGHVPASALKAFERMMGERGGATHAIDPRLIARIGIVSSHFGGRSIDVVSGYRAASSGNAWHSSHNDGRAIDFRVRGVDGEALSEFCRTLRNTGCGFYPNASLLHLDVRDSKAYWVDWSRTGESASGEGPVADAEEGARASVGGGGAPIVGVLATGVSDTHALGSPVTTP